jgi:hypothetical protein
MGNFSDLQANQASGDSGESSHILAERPSLLHESRILQASSPGHQDELNVQESNPVDGEPRFTVHIRQKLDNSETSARHQPYPAEMAVDEDDLKAFHQQLYHLQIPFVGREADIAFALQFLQQAATPTDRQVYGWIFGLKVDNYTQCDDLTLLDKFKSQTDKGTGNLALSASVQLMTNQTAEPPTDNSLYGVGAWAWDSNSRRQWSKL